MKYKVTTKETEAPIKMTTNQSADQATNAKSKDAFEVYTSTKMFNAMKPLFIVLSVFGLYYSKEFGSVADCKYKIDSKNTGMHCDQEKRKRKRPSCSQIYSLVIFLIMMIWYLRLFTMFTYGNLSFGPELFAKCSVMTWSTLLMPNLMLQIIVHVLLLIFEIKSFLCALIWFCMFIKLAVIGH